MVLFAMKIRATFRLTTVLLLLHIGANATSKPPHIIFMLIDDLGWNDISFHGSLQIPTPNIDSLAYSGVILNNYYVQPLCTPSRGSLMTGKYPIKLGLQHNVIYATEPWGLSPHETIMPQYLKTLGYATHGIGKWHLGYFRNDYVPSNRGFDSFFGYWNGKGDYFTHFQVDEIYSGLDFHDNANNVRNYTGYYATEAYTDRAKTVIKNHNSSQPLFLYIAHQAVHAGNTYATLQAPPEYVKKFSHIKDHQRRVFAGMISALDKSVGEVVSALDEADFLKNSIIVFSTDNGGAVEGIDGSTGSNWPLRGSKYNLWEGGIRGTAFIWSPLLLHSKGHISEAMMHITDWLPTLFAAAGGDPKTLGDIDGYNLWESIDQNRTSPRDHILYNIDPIWNVESIRKGRYKMLKGSVFDGAFDGWFDKEGKKEKNKPFEKKDLEIQNKVYKKELDESKVVHIVLNKFIKDFRLGYDLSDNLKSQQCEVGNELEVCNKVNTGTKEEKESFPHFLAPPVEVKCGTKPANASTNCQPLKEACLFDIENDPCEFNNLANRLPSVLQELQKLLDKYRTQVVPTRNRPSDPKANPKYHGYAWVPWIEKDIRL